MPGSVMPVPRQQFSDGNGAPYAGGKLYTYIAGTTTPLPAYQDADLAVPHTNPIILDSAGRATVYLAATGYKFVLTTSGDVAVYTQDNVFGVATLGSANDVLGTAGETLAAREAVVLSDGSLRYGGAGTAGRWVRADANDAAASPLSYLTPVLGIATQAIALGASGTIRLTGLLTGFAGLTPGAIYYVSTSPGVLSTTRAQNARILGMATAADVLLVRPEPLISADLQYDFGGFFFGGTSTIGRADLNYPAGVLATSFAPGTHLIRLVQNRIPPGRYKFRGMLAIDNALGTVTAGLVNLTSGLTLLEITSTSVTGALVESVGSTSIAHATTAINDFAVKIKTSNAAYLAYGWGFELYREKF